MVSGPVDSGVKRASLRILYCTVGDSWQLSRLSCDQLVVCGLLSTVVWRPLFTENGIAFNFVYSCRLRYSTQQWPHCTQLRVYCSSKVAYSVLYAVPRYSCKLSAPASAPYTLH